MPMARKRSRTSSRGGGPGGGSGAAAGGVLGSAGGGQAGSFLPTVATAAIVAVTVAAAPADARALVTSSGAAVVLVVLAGSAQAWRRARAVAALRAQVHEQRVARTASLIEHEAQIVRLVQDLLPGTIHLLRKGASVQDVLSGVQLDPGLSRSSEAAHIAVLRSVLDAVKAEEDLRQYAQRAFVNIARRVQSIVHQQSEDVREMEHRHGADQAVFGDLLHLDHGMALIGRLADSLAVLGGERPGRPRRQPVPLFSVLRGAMSRSIDYRRVEIHEVAETAIAGPVVEPLIHALAELLDNATRYSPADSWVYLTAKQVQAGIAVEIEDAGVGLSEPAAARAERLLAQVTTGLDLADMGQTPRLGMSVVGRLAQAYGFSVSLRESAYGGVRAVLYLPRELLTELVEPGGTAEIAPPAAEAAADQAGWPREQQGFDYGPGFLPQRRRRANADAATRTVQVTMPDAGPDLGVMNGGGAGSGTVLTDHIDHTAHAAQAGPWYAEQPGAHAEAQAAAHTRPSAGPRPEPGLWLSAFLNGAEDLDGPTDTTPRKDDQW
jgi:signal transduction histidine kinase